MSNPASVQSDALYDGLSSFYKAVSDAIEAATTVPSVGSISTSLVSTDLQTAASINSRATPTYAVGATVEAAHLAVAVLREYGMRVKGKSEYYTDGVIDHSNESNYYDKLKYAQRAAIFGGSVNGSMTQ